MPFVVCHYIAVTGDESVLDEVISFVHSPPLEPHQQERYETPTITSQTATLYEHCRRALDHGFRTGVHGLPLMGCGDWNDGMNKVGEEGRGESVWVGWFLLVVLARFLPIMKHRGDTDQAADWQIRQAALRNAIETNAWDGEWYRRAYFAVETPLGSVQNDECQIDSLAQTWAVIAGGDPIRSRQAVEAVMDRLVEWKAKLVLLFTPPFNTSRLDPGYIKGYVPGIRENGGQYTHSASWLIQALTMLGDGNRAAQIFDLINPVNHATTRDQAALYQVEPYVICADVYGVPPHTGRGGWTWYTGSAAWFYRAAIEFILGFQLRGKQVQFSPRIPDAWDGFQFRFRNRTGEWLFKVVREGTVQPPSLVGSLRMTVESNSPIPLNESNSRSEILITIPRSHSHNSKTGTGTDPSLANSAADPQSSDRQNGLLADDHADGIGENVVGEVAQ
jgi:cyclic beta-1,2-glucan synthetase